MIKPAGGSSAASSILSGSKVRPIKPSMPSDSASPAREPVDDAGSSGGTSADHLMVLKRKIDMLEKDKKKILEDKTRIMNQYQDHIKKTLEEKQNTNSGAQELELKMSQIETEKEKLDLKTKKLERELKRA